MGGGGGGGAAYGGGGAVATVEALVPEDDGSAEAAMRERLALRYNTVRPSCPCWASRTRWGLPPHINFLGRYLFNIKASGPGHGLRPFRDPEAFADDED
ncbi:hypothetical protein OG471_41105 [Streptomyces sp. NBC_01336]|nr:hypothetical protein OG471_41105 [Streptomyces sp. NBC_01336]